ncbi:carbohydrate binding family 9 domain-containing protein [Candidatus Poribacteria bacterium]|nr:carbohydrate binding family 9 domain-containing protein [Candidatus Poribacteria bacterium]MYH79835.1 carbohydrate binding family 9 domain-containing protein [Candidatus Poribacteria bacterium]MYK94006.1 carbohydrate binding family 9 domain-containing protein [Candidatus Poribacteria bacterium]
MRHRIVLLIFAAIAAATLNVEANKEIKPLLTREAIEIDGHLSEEAWSQTQMIDDFIQQSPSEGQPITERTEVRMLYDTEKLYIGFECYDSEPDKIVANEMRRDGQLWQNDNVYIMLDTYGDKRQCFFFRTNALGALSDTAVTDGGENLNGSWDCIWEAAGRQHEKGWTVEIAIPFNQLRFKKNDSMVWGVNFGRNIQRTNETSQWIQVPRSQSWPGTYHPIYQGKLTGLQGVASPSYFDAKPYLLGGLARNLEDGDWQRTTERDLGLDMKYGITSNLTLDLTLNTDFAQVEADQEEVNLTRFSLYFPERRDFFLEGSGLFAFGAGIGDFGPPPLSVFYSRSIGIEDEKEVRLLGGGKLTGKVGAYSVGALNMTTAASGEIPMTNFSVLRMQRDILSDSTVGFILTNRQSDFGNDYHRNGGIDLFFRPHDQWRMRAMTVGSWSPDPEERDMAWYLSNNWRNKHFRVNASYLDIGPQFTSKMGFMHRRNIRSLMLDTDYEIQISRYGVRDVGTGFAGGYLLDHDNNPIGWEARIGGNMLLESDDGFSLNVQRSFDRVDESFSVGDGEIPAGDYEMNQVSLRGFTESSRPFAVFGRAEYGDYFHGNRVGVSLDSQWRMTYQLAIETRYQRNWINLPEIDLFTTNVVGTRISYALNTRFFTKLYAQWNDSAERVSANFLLNYIYRPGSDFYLVYDQAWDTSDGFHAHDWTVLSKFTYLLSL